MHRERGPLQKSCRVAKTDDSNDPGVTETESRSIETGLNDRIGTEAPDHLQISSVFLLLLEKYRVRVARWTVARAGVVRS